MGALRRRGNRGRHRPRDLPRSEFSPSAFLFCFLFYFVVDMLLCVFVASNVRFFINQLFILCVCVCVRVCVCAEMPHGSYVSEDGASSASSVSFFLILSTACGPQEGTHTAMSADCAHH